MSTLVVATLKSNSSSPPAFQNTSGTEIGTLCRAWCNWNGTGVVAIRAQFNVSSITDNGTGNYTVNFSTALVDTNYAPLSTSGQNAATNPGANTAYSRTTTGVTIVHWESGAVYDLMDMYVAVFR